MVALLVPTFIPHFPRELDITNTIERGCPELADPLHEFIDCDHLTPSYRGSLAYVPGGDLDSTELVTD
jgi:hypothetical protein